jgi:hypothetical protein
VSMALPFAVESVMIYLPRAYLDRGQQKMFIGAELPCQQKMLK